MEKLDTLKELNESKQVEGKSAKPLEMKPEYILDEDERWEAMLKQ